MPECGMRNVECGISNRPSRARKASAREDADFLQFCSDKEAVSIILAQRVSVYGIIINGDGYRGEARHKVVS